MILPDEYSTGSSLMPQKKNPDSWELLRGKTGRITGALFSLFTTLKGLPSSYQRDLQEDKEALFAAHDQISDMLAVAAGALAKTKFREDRLRAAASNPALLATDAADYLVRRGVPFRQAHDLVGQGAARSRKTGQILDTALLQRSQKNFSALRGRLPAGPVGGKRHRLQSRSGWHRRRIRSGCHRAAGAKSRSTGETIMNSVASILETASCQAEDRRSLR